MTTSNPMQDEFAALLEESFGDNDVLEGAVVKGTITAIEKDMAVIDVGLKVEGRVPLREIWRKSQRRHYECRRYRRSYGETH